MDNITLEIAKSYLGMYEKTEDPKDLVKESVNMKERAHWVPESIADEDVADFMGAAAAAAKKGDKSFKLGDKVYKVTMKKSTANKIDEAEVQESGMDESKTVMVVKPGKDEKGKSYPVICVPKDKQKEYLNKGWVLAEVTKDTDVPEPRAKGEKDFKNMHTQNTLAVDGQEIANDTFDRIKKSGPIGK